MPKGERKVPLDIAILMTGIAALFDLLNGALDLFTFGIGGLVMDFLSAVIFWMWLEYYDVHLWRGKNTGWSLGATFVSALPADLLFPWAIRVGSLAFFDRKEIAPDINTRNAITPGGYRL